MRAGRFVLFAGVTTARAVVLLTLALGFWAAAPTAVGWMPTSVMTASMAPAILVGDVVVSRPVPRDALLPGRVVLATDPDRPERLRLHRIVEVDAAGRVTTKGDANPSADSSPLHPDAVRGVGVLRVPWVGLPVVWARTGEVLPLAAAVLGFAACLALALRRGDDDEPGSPPPTADAAASPPLTRRALRARTTAPTALRRARRALGLATVAAVATGAGATPAWAALSDASAASASVAAGRVVAAAGLACDDDLDGVEIAWTYTGPTPRSFDLLVDGRIVERDIPPNARTARVPNDGSYSFLRTSTVTVRTNLGARWSAESTASVRIRGAFLGFGRPACR